MCLCLVVLFWCAAAEKTTTTTCHMQVEILVYLSAVIQAFDCSLCLMNLRALSWLLKLYLIGFKKYLRMRAFVWFVTSSRVLLRVEICKFHANWQQFDIICLCSSYLILTLVAWLAIT